jgi:hypothetical protein
MDFIDVLRQFSSRANKMYAQIQTEEATKTSLIMPFFQQVLGYDVFNPDEFVPEFTADVGIKKGEKVDYAILIDGAPTILVEAKWCGEPLDRHASQLFRYFGTTTAKIGILTNGLIYKFYTDLDEPNKMDMKPFLEVDILNIRELIVPELKRFCRSTFNVNEIFDRASELKYSNEIKAYFTSQLREPDDDFIKFMCGKAYSGVKTQAVVDRFRPIVKSSLNNLITEMMNERISSALKSDADKEEDPKDVVHASPEPPDSDAEENLAKKSQIITTETELEAFHIIKACLSGVMDLSKITYKDTTNYFSVNYNGYPTKWIARVRFGVTKNYFSTRNPDGDEIRHDIEIPADIYKFRDEIIQSALYYEQ